MQVAQITNAGERLRICGTLGGYRQTSSAWTHCAQHVANSSLEFGKFLNFFQTFLKYKNMVKSMDTECQLLLLLVKILFYKSRCAC